MAKKNDIQLLVQVSKMYYLQNMTQAEIAREIGVSRPAVSLLLSEAMQNGMIEINIKDPLSDVPEVSALFQQRFSLQHCRVVPTTVKEEGLLRKIVASQGVVLVKALMANGIIMGIAWGKSCYEFMQEFLPAEDFFDIEVVPLIGGSNLTGVEFQLNETVRMFAEKLNGIPYFIYAPALVESVADRSLYLKSAYMLPIIEMWKNLDLAIVTAGRDPEYETYVNGNSLKTLNDLVKKVNRNPNRPVGDICALQFNIQGEFVNKEYNDRILGVGQQNLRAAKSVFCVASGMSRVLSIIGLLNTGIVDSLVIDEGTAAKVLEVLDKGLINCL